MLQHCRMHHLEHWPMASPLSDCCRRRRRWCSSGEQSVYTNLPRQSKTQSGPISFQEKSEREAGKTISTEKEKWRVRWTETSAWLLVLGNFSSKSRDWHQKRGGGGENQLNKRWSQISSSEWARCLRDGLRRCERECQSSVHFSISINSLAELSDLTIHPNRHSSAAFA